MKYLVRSMLTLFVSLIIYLLIYRLCFSYDIKSTGSTAQWISLLIAVVIGIFFWIKAEKISNSLAGYMIGLGALGGFIGLMVGLWGPILLLPSNNLAPLLGMVIITPAGFLLGVLLGVLQWKKKGGIIKISD